MGWSSKLKKLDHAGLLSGDNKLKNSSDVMRVFDPLDVMGGQAAEEAAASQVEAANYAADVSSETQQELFDRGQAATAPWRESGGRALGMLSDIYGVNRGDAVGSGDSSLALQQFRSSPAYQNRMNASREGAIDAVNNTRDANPRMLDELRRVSSGIADRGFTDYTRGLQSMAGVGQSMAGQTAGQSANLGQSLGQTYQNQAQQVGSANAQAVINQANQMSNTLNQAASMYGSYRGNAGTASNYNADAGRHMGDITNYGNMQTVPRY